MTRRRPRDGVSAERTPRGLVRFLPHREPPTRTLVCFPWSGAGSAWFGAWAAEMPPDVELLAVALPGRGSRGAEGVERWFDVLARHVTAAIATYRRTRHLALVGHSFGALLGYQVAVNLQQQDIAVDTLVASGSRAPTVRPVVELHKLDDTRLIEQLRHLGGLPADHAEDAWRQRFLDRTRADLAACETFQPPDPPRLSCDVTTWVGTTDWYAPATPVQEWAAVVARPVRHRTFPGDHFFLKNLGADVVLHELGWTPSRRRDTA
jgi:surfactin synthase thioesterase subunit